MLISLFLFPPNSNHFTCLSYHLSLSLSLSPPHAPPIYEASHVCAEFVASITGFLDKERGDGGGRGPGVCTRTEPQHMNQIMYKVCP